MRNNIAKVFLLILIVAITLPVNAKDKKSTAKDDAKELSGISIVGNKEAPKSLFIVPWKSSDLSAETGLSSRLLNEKMEAVDKEVFERELEFYSATVD